MTSERTSRVRSGQQASLLAALTGFMLITLDTFMVNVALPHIRDDFGDSVSGMLWVINGYTIMFAAFMLFAGAMADRLGSKRTFRLGVLGFMVAGVICAVAPTIGILVAGRFLLGSFAALMLPSSLALLRDAYPIPAERARAISIWAIGGGGASAFGPLIGGVLLLGSWRFIFILYVPLCAVVIWVLRAVPESPTGKGSFHWPSQIASGLTMISLVFGLIHGGVQGFDDPLAIASLLLALVSLVVFVWLQATVTNPLVPPAVVRSRIVVASCVVGAAFVIGFYGLIFLLSLYLQDQRHLSGIETGIAFMPMTVTSIGINLIAARSAERFGMRVPMIGGLALVALGLGGLALFATNVSMVGLTLLTVPIGIGGALAMPVATAWLVNSVPNELVGTAIGLINTFRQAAGAISIAIYGLLITQSRSFDFGMRVSLTIGVGALLVAMSLIWFATERHRSTS